MFPLRDELPSSKTPSVTYALMAANVAMFLWQLSIQAGLEAQITAELAYQAQIHRFNPVEYLYSLWLRDHGLVPALIMDAPADHLMSLFRGIFLHGGWMHLIGNLWFLYIFGDNVEDRLGHSTYLAFYIGCGVAASVAQVGANTASQVPIIGASGAIAGVLGAYVILFPKAKVVTVVPVLVFFHVIRIPAAIFLAVWLVFQNLVPVSQAASDGVAYWAHIGGFLAGVAYILPRRSRYTQSSKPYRGYRAFDRDGYWG